MCRVLTVTLPKPTPNSSLTFTTTYACDNWDSASGLLFTTITDPNGHVTSQGYDALGRLVRSIGALNNTTTYAYTRDVLASITDANGNVTSNSYDVNHRLSRTTFPNGAHEDYTYYADGLLDTKTDRKGQTITYAYDALKRLASKTYPNTTSIGYTYTGQALTQVVDGTTSPSETHTFGYDAAYRVNAVTEGGRGSLAYTYTGDDRVATMNVGSGPSTAYAYYPDGSLDTIAWSAVTGQFKYAYTLAGQYQTITFPNNQTRGFTYDNQGRLPQLANLHPTVGTLASFGYGYDIDPQTGQPTLLGQRTTLAMTIPSQSLTNATSSYLYDADYQLTQASYPSPTPYNGEVDSWTYDAIGNRLTNTVNGSTQTYAYFKNGSNQRNGQRLSSDSVNAYTYDANGNTITRNGNPGNFTFGWDAEDRMTSISGAAAASYGYDFRGRRSFKAASGATTSYIYDGLNLIRASSASNAIDYLFGPGIDEPLASLQSGNPSYFSVDGLGSVSLLSDPVGSVQNSYLYDAWGVTRSQTGSLANDFGYTARESGEAGLWYYRARYYQAGVGRFGSEDPLYSVAPGYIFGPANLVAGKFWGSDAPDSRFHRDKSDYAYARLDPVFSSDPSGMDVLICVRRGRGFLFSAFNHGYFWDDRTNTPCGMGNSSGGASTTSEAGPNTDTCMVVGGSRGKEDQLMGCCNQLKNIGPWTPGGSWWYAHDCFGLLDYCSGQHGCKARFPAGRCGPIPDPVVTP